MKLQLQSLAQSVDAFDRALAVERQIAGKDAGMDEVIRGGVIQAFEVCYEQCWKMMKRWVETQGEAASVDGVPRRELFRIAAEHRLIADVDLWMGFHRARGETCHTYDGGVLARVVETARNFSGQAQSFLSKIEALNADA